MQVADIQSWTDVALRMGLATVVGILVGINREMHHKPIGMRTLGLVAVGSCMLVLSVLQYAQLHNASSSDAASRVVQGLVAGLGFLGAGVIMRSNDQQHVYGLTTAAAIVVVAALGIACALALWPILLCGFAASVFLLVVCDPLERRLQSWIDRRPPE
ncbi:MAG: MgtC/SapB family protein [Nevskia sp.]|nr:MgtC/SapB family protein [Nevskia sp.]